MRQLPADADPLSRPPPAVPVRARAIAAAALLGALVALADACSQEASQPSEDATAELPFGFDTGAPLDVDDGADADSSDGASGCPGAAGCPCSANADCDSAVCAPTAAGQRCAALCGADDCAADEACVPIGTSDGDPIQACLPRFAALCDPCKSDAACSPPGASGGRCVPWGGDGAFCGTACEGDGDCPAGFGCTDALGLGGQPVRQCRPKGGATCACSPHAIANELQTPCLVAGAGGAACPGSRACLAAGKDDAPPGGGLSACLGKAPGPEACDGSDNDCDGDTDEGDAGCGDDEPCTVDGCVGAACSHTPNPLGCDDGDPCTVGDACADAGGVIACKGKPLACDDGDPCTLDSCGSGGCAKTPQAGATCDDGDACTSGDACQADAGGAIGCLGVAKACDDANPCTSEACAPATGLCLATALTGTSCDDGDACTSGDACALGIGGGVCVGGINKVCDDGNACTLDGCDPAKGCTFAADVGQATACYEGAAGTAGVAACKAGSATCGADGALGPCQGQVLPAKEACGGGTGGGDGVDDDCDGQTDDGCTAQPPQVRWRLAGAQVRGAAGGAAFVVGVGSGVSGDLATAQAGKPAVALGFYQTLRALWK